MTRNEARKIIKTYAQTRYSNSEMLILLKIVDLTYRGKDSTDDAGREIDTTTASLMRAGKVKSRRWADILKKLKDDGVLLDVEHSEKKISCRLDLEPIARLERWADKEKVDRKAYDKKRTERARESRREIKRLTKLINDHEEALNKALREFVIWLHKKVILARLEAEPSKPETGETK